MSHVSFFKKIQNEQSNPIKEFKKITCFINNRQDLYNELNYAYVECSLLNKQYPYFHEYSALFNKLQKAINDSKEFDDYSQEDKEELLDLFLDYCESISYIIDKLIDKLQYDSHSFYSDTIEQVYQLQNIIEASVKNNGYFLTKGKTKDTPYVATKKDTYAESIGKASESNLEEAIKGYLSIRKSNTSGKKEKLITIINFLEPVFNAFNADKAETFANNSLNKSKCGPVHRIHEYVQLFRHEQRKINDPVYKDFYANENKLCDKLFLMCLFVKNYKLVIEGLNEFDSLKKAK